MQSSISNKTGHYTLLDNAKAFSENPSKIFELNPIIVWQEGKGNMWTLDHRRLGAARPADLDKIPVQWASKAEVYQDAWKFSIRVDGKSISLKIGKGLKEVIE
ncbi:ParB/Srx family N-terminal domain-containing protein [Paenibacillus silvae]|uniref:ParB/Srx family N-terminal domain-containing protein n=1 Tax=Paenibacillus silvae TaxID=1325358 RepID=UPI0011A7AE85|nr:MULTISPECIES: ParB/Srx family N-terminal domain-containing protein [Paenibacillus]MDM5281752.1 ParB/Srx family N-terminal domain-containing protein [Paenibacillus silvae]